MPIADKYTVEELVIDDSFHNYCLNRDPSDVFFWEVYLETYPHKAPVIQEARELVLALQQAMSEIDAEDQTAPPEVLGVRRHPLRWFMAAAAAAVLLVIGVKSYWTAGSHSTLTGGAVSAHVPATSLIYTAALGEKKVILLPDSTTVHLNAGSTLRLTKGFGEQNRSLFLSGEALFDVTHRPGLPFVVHVGSYDIKVLGTLFNVRAYPGEKISETALLRGKVQILKSDGGDLTLMPNQKVIFKSLPMAAALPDSGKAVVRTIQKIIPLQVNPRDGRVSEIAWADNRLEIVNESFNSLRSKLERWYNVQIIFEDPEVGTYRFTATFEKENITDVLKALQYAYPFTYEMRDGKITISK